MTVTGVRRDARSPADYIHAIYTPDRLAEAVAGADHVVVTLPGGTATASMFDARIFDAMKPGAYFYNVGRGSVVDEDELIRRLENGRLGGAALDVFRREPLPDDSPLWTLENVLVTPHMAGTTGDFGSRLVDLINENLRRYHTGEPLLNVINLREEST
ncbi:MAG: hypothetical protein IPK19_20495 [Chloroflexi bacterium]|nr:hypothetical protein [Chloroflexota bacterium]